MLRYDLDFLEKVNSIIEIKDINNVKRLRSDNAKEFAVMFHDINHDNNERIRETSCNNDNCDFVIFFPFS